MAFKVTIPWGYLCVLLLNVKGHSNIFHLFLYRVWPDCIAVYLIEFICMGDLPWYPEVILAGNLLHSRLNLGDKFIFLLQSEWGLPCKCRFFCQLISFRILCSLDSMWLLHILQCNQWVFPSLQCTSRYHPLVVCLQGLFPFLDTVNASLFGNALPSNLWFFMWSIS